MELNTPDNSTAAGSLQDTAVETAENETLELVVEELLVEEISIDGMCGVY